jgi:hypothetical protein
MKVCSQKTEGVKRPDTCLRAQDGLGCRAAVANDHLRFHNPHFGMVAVTLRARSFNFLLARRGVVVEAYTRQGAMFPFHFGWTSSPSRKPSSSPRGRHKFCGTS